MKIGPPRRRMFTPGPAGAQHVAPLQGDLTLARRGGLDAGAGVGAEAVASAHFTVLQCATSLRGLRRGAAGAAACYGSGRRAEGDRSRGQRANVLGIGAPVERLVAELHVEITRRAEKIDARRAEGWGDVGLREIKQAGARVGRIGDGNIEPAVRSLHGDGSDR